MSGKRAEIPSFRFRLPDLPLAGAATAIGKVSVTVRLRLRGVLDVWSADSAGALTILDGLVAGIFVQGVDSAEPRISSAARHEFRQTCADRDAGGLFSFTGTCAVRFTRADDLVTGEPEYRLEVRAARTHGDPGDDLGHELAALGGLKLVGSSISAEQSLRRLLKPS
ncbi:hypothetical protein [Amycolatopsis nigrescens]|uniref:hypothetical protein n=1 Tax=Amycolatopsis nigrescens TaxID=381445 RepID=UPI0003660AD8|nr:hypothetical protein [Amycolatopsis nigrescens]